MVKRTASIIVHSLAINRNNASPTLSFFTFSETKPSLNTVQQYWPRLMLLSLYLNVMFMSACFCLAIDE